MALIAPITSLPTQVLQPLSPQAIEGNDAAGKTFADTMQEALSNLNNQQNHAAGMAKDFALGKTSDIHSVMIAAEEATVSFQMATQVRNKIIDAYQEIMRISM